MGSTYSTETYFSVDSDKNGYKYAVQFDNDFIGAGTCRYAYCDTIKSSSPADGPRNGDSCVVKVFKKDYARNYDQWVPDLVAHERAAKMVDHFTKAVKTTSLTPKPVIKVMTPLVAKVRFPYRCSNLLHRHKLLVC